MSIHRRLRLLEAHARATAPAPPPEMTLMQLVAKDRPTFGAVMGLVDLREVLTPEQLEAHPDYQRLKKFIAERWLKFEAAGRPREGLDDQDEVDRSMPEIDWTVNGVAVTPPWGVVPRRPANQPGT